MKIKIKNKTPISATKRNIPVRKSNTKYTPRSGDIDISNNEIIKQSVLVSGIMIGIIILATLILFKLFIADKAEAFGGIAHNLPTYSIEERNINTILAWNGKHKAIKVWKSQTKEMNSRGYSNTRILDLTSLRMNECNLYSGDCKGYARDKNGIIIKPLRISDYGPFQINKASHPEAFKISMELGEKKEWGKLYNYQLTYANSMLDRFMRDYCDLRWAKTNERRFKCIAISYNGHPRYKHTYSKIAWLKREIIKEALYIKD